MAARLFLSERGQAVALTRILCIVIASVGMLAIADEVTRRFVLRETMGAQATRARWKATCGAFCSRSGRRFEHPILMGTACSSGCCWRRRSAAGRGPSTVRGRRYRSRSLRFPRRRRAQRSSEPAFSSMSGSREASLCAGSCRRPAPFPSSRRSSCSSEPTRLLPALPHFRPGDRMVSRSTMELRRRSRHAIAHSRHRPVRRMGDDLRIGEDD